MIASQGGWIHDPAAASVIDNISIVRVVGFVTASAGLWDTSGKAEYDRLRPLAYPQTDAFVVCFSVVDPTSFENALNKWVSGFL